MASVVRYRDGWRCYAYVAGKRVTKTFRLQSEAKTWGRAVEAQSGRMAFSVASERFLAWKLPQLDPVNQQKYEQSIRDHVLPVIGTRKLTDITRRELVALVRGVAEKGKVETAHRVGQRICAIFDYAVDSGEIESHPAAGLSRVLPAKTPRKMPAVTAQELPDLMRAIASYPEPVTRLGLMLLAHTFVRTSELTGARWAELKGSHWVIPGERMKRGLPHGVPITPHVRQILADLEPMTGESEFILASREPSQPISNNTMLFALYRLGYKGRMTGHGYRAVAFTILNESGLFSRDAVERQLAHSETDEVRNAYLRAEFLPERTRMMAWWSDHLRSASLSITHR